MPEPRTKLVYLTGPITGLPETEAVGWRRSFGTLLKGDIRCIDPTRDRVDTTPDNEITVEKLRHGHASVTRDRADVLRSDILVANFLGATTVSIGSVGELFWADAYRKPIIVAMEPGNVHYHLFILELAGWVVSDITQAATQVNLILSEL
jgi:hypothetical protein